MPAKRARRSIRKTVRDVVVPTTLGISLAVAGCSGTPDTPAVDGAADKPADALRDRQIYYIVMPPDTGTPDTGTTASRDASDEVPYLYILPVMP